MKSLNERSSEIQHNMNPLFLKIGSLANVHFEGMTEKILDVRTTIFPMVGGSVLAEILEREPDPRKADSESVFKFLLGSYGANIECWSSPSGRKFVLITNGRRGKRRKTFEMFPVRKTGAEGVWVEFEETIRA